MDNLKKYAATVEIKFSARGNNPLGSLHSLLRAAMSDLPDWAHWDHYHILDTPRELSEEDNGDG